METEEEDEEKNEDNEEDEERYFGTLEQEPDLQNHQKVKGQELEQSQLTEEDDRSEQKSENQNGPLELKVGAADTIDEGIDELQDEEKCAPLESSEWKNNTEVSESLQDKEATLSEVAEIAAATRGEVENSAALYSNYSQETETIRKVRRKYKPLPSFKEKDRFIINCSNPGASKGQSFLFNGIKPTNLGNLDTGEEDGFIKISDLVIGEDEGPIGTEEKKGEEKVRKNTHAEETLKVSGDQGSCTLDGFTVLQLDLDPGKQTYLT